MALLHSRATPSGVGIYRQIGLGLVSGSKLYGKIGRQLKITTCENIDQALIEAKEKD